MLDVRSKQLIVSLLGDSGGNGQSEPKTANVGGGLYSLATTHGLSDTENKFMHGKTEKLYLGITTSTVQTITPQIPCSLNWNEHEGYSYHVRETVLDTKDAQS